MSDTEFDVVIAAYLIPDLAQKEFDALVKLVEDEQLEVEGVALVTVGADGTVAIYDRAKTDTVNTTLASAVRKSVAQVDGGGAKHLKGALAEAQAGMGGEGGRVTDDSPSRAHLGDHP